MFVRTAETRKDEGSTTMVAEINQLDVLKNFAALSSMSLQEALTIFDDLPVVDIETIIGRWHGAGVHTGHPMDGMLEAFGWYGKQFNDRDHVHPLIFQDNRGELFALDPQRLPFNLALKSALVRELSKGSFGRQAMLTTRVAMQTHRTKARVRMLEYRGKVSASMIYDNLPIIDSFRLLDHDTLLGAMDLKGMDKPFMFRLRRDT
jgi:hypothetical protein